jgi:hypothetical protein
MLEYNLEYNLNTYVVSWYEHNNSLWISVKCPTKGSALLSKTFNILAYVICYDTNLYGY